MKYFKLFSVLFIAIFLSACVNVQTQQVDNAFGGVFVSADRGETWRHMPLMPTTSGTPGSINEVDVNRLVMDPSDSGAVYLASFSSGMYYTYNIGRGWNKSTFLPQSSTVNDIAIDYRNKCGIYTAVLNKLHFSSDCGRTFVEVYNDDNVAVAVTAVAIDPANSNILYIGTSRGDVIRSLDAGRSWGSIQRLDNSIRKILINPNDTRSVFVATVKAGIYQFNTAGGANFEQLERFRNQFDNTNWISFEQELKEFEIGQDFVDLIFSKEDNSLILATKTSILRSFDEGKSWLKLGLISPEEETNINAIAVNPQNGDELFYLTNVNIYRSFDSGNNWNIKEIPTARAGSSIIVDFNNPDILYMGIKRIPEEDTRRR